MGEIRKGVTRFWDDYINRWLDGDDSLPSPLDDWFWSYRGTGRGAPTLAGMPEPYGGDLAGIDHEPRLVLLGLNPGAFSETFQSRTGIFSDEVRETGSHSRWLTSWPYLREPWTQHFPRPIPYVANRILFAQRWLEDPGASLKDLLTFEMYPWHSTIVNAPMKPSDGVLRDFIWEPLSEFNVDLIWAFGADWRKQAELLELPLIENLGYRGRDYGSRVESRAVRVYGLPTGQRLVVEWHKGGAGPPAADEVEPLRQALS